MSIPTKGEIELSGFLSLAPVLLRAQSRRVLAELVATAAADLIPELSFSGLLLTDQAESAPVLVAHRDKRLLRADETAAILVGLPAWFLQPPEQATVLEPPYAGPELLAVHHLLGAATLYLAPARTPTNRFGYLLGGSNLKLSAPAWKYFRSLGELAAIAFDNAARIEDMREAAKEMSLVNEMAGALAASLNGEELFNSFIGQLRNVVPLDRANLMLLSPPGQSYNIPFSWSHLSGHSSRLYLKDMPLAGSPFEEAVQQKEVRWGNWQLELPEPGLAEVNIFSPLYASQLIIPLIAKRRVLGVLVLGRVEPTNYGNDEARQMLLEKLASLFALALLNSRLYEEKQLSAEFDSRVGVFNHDYFDRELATHVRKAHRNKYRLGLMMVDMDNLKTVNDRFGHLAGDAALRHIANLISHTVRTTDVVARYGGDEFGVMLPGCTPLGLEVVAEKTRRAIQNTPLVLEGGQEINLTVSIGAVLCPDDAATPLELIQQADAAMYVAKSYRNQVRVGLTAQIPRVSDFELGQAEGAEANPGGEAQVELSVEDYERALLSLVGRVGVEGQVVQELTERLTDARQQLSELTEQISQFRTGAGQSLQVLAELSERREPYLLGTGAKLSRLVRLAGEKLGLGEAEIAGLEAASWLTNLGRVGLPETVWNRPGPIEEENWPQVRQVPTETVQLLASLAHFLPPHTIPTLQYMRESFDGSGYPAHRVGEEIPLTARLAGAASALVAMSQARPHRSARSRQECRQELERGAGRQFEARIADLLVALLEAGQLDFLDFE